MGDARLRRFPDAARGIRRDLRSPEARAHQMGVEPNIAHADYLDVPRDTQDGYALDVNDFGEVVGELDTRKVKGGQTSAPRWHAYMWRNGTRVELGKQIDQSSDWDKLSTASTINNAGLIGGVGRFDVQRRGFLMIPNDL